MAGSPPEVQHLAGHHARLGGLALLNVVQEELAVAHHGVGSLPALFHPCRFGDLTGRGRSEPFRAISAERGWGGGGLHKARWIYMGQLARQPLQERASNAFDLTGFSKVKRGAFTWRSQPSC